MNNIKNIRKCYKFNQSDLAKLLNVTQQTISNWENGTTEIDKESIKKLMERFKVSSDYILGLTDLPIELSKLKFNDNVIPINLNNYDMNKVPILGSIAAGNPREAIANNDIDDYIITDVSYRNKDLCFGLRVTGTSMEPRIYEGDVAIIELCDWVTSGEIAAVRVNNDDTTLKKVKFEQDGMWLIGFNPSFQPIYYTATECAELPVTVIGRLVQVIQKY